ncbi:hypothetical protein ACPC54_17805 [Kitasatospora sp. NPDC094028]
MIRRLRIVRIDDPRPALELQRPNGTGWFLAPLPPRARLRFRFHDWPRPRLCLEDTPRPKCSECRGTGGWERDYGDPETGEYASTEWDPCDCWLGYHEPVLTIQVPHWAARRLFGWCEPQYSTEPPF